MNEIHASLFYVFKHGAVGKYCVTLCVESTTLVENFEQVNTLKVTKVYFNKIYRFWEGELIFPADLCVSVFLLSSIPFCVDPGG